MEEWTADFLLAIIFPLIGGILTVIFVNGMQFGIGWLMLFGVAIVTYQSFNELDEKTQGAIIRLGKPIADVKQGWYFLLPLFYRVVRFPLAEIQIEIQNPPKIQSATATSGQPKAYQDPSLIDKIVRLDSKDEDRAIYRAYTEMYINFGNAKEALAWQTKHLPLGMTLDEVKEILDKNESNNQKMTLGPKFVIRGKILKPTWTVQNVGDINALIRNLQSVVKNEAQEMAPHFTVALAMYCQKQFTTGLLQAVEISVGDVSSDAVKNLPLGERQLKEEHQMGYDPFGVNIEWGLSYDINRSMVLRSQATINKDTTITDAEAQREKIRLLKLGEVQGEEAQFELMLRNPTFVSFILDQETRRIVAQKIKELNEYNFGDKENNLFAKTTALAQFLGTQVGASVGKNIPVQQADDQKQDNTQSARGGVATMDAPPKTTTVKVEKGSQWNPPPRTDKKSKGGKRGKRGQ